MIDADSPAPVPREVHSNDGDQRNADPGVQAGVGTFSCGELRNAPDQQRDIDADSHWT